MTQLSLRSPVRLDSQKNLKRSDFRHRVARIVFKPDRRKHILAWLIIGACRVVKDRSWKSKSTATGQIPLVGLFAFAMHSVEYPSSLSRAAESVNGQEWIFGEKTPARWQLAQRWLRERFPNTLVIMDVRVIACQAELAIPKRNHHTPWRPPKP